MAAQTVTLQLPEEVYNRVKRDAEAMKQPVEKVLVEAISAAVCSADGLPFDIKEELEALVGLSDDELWGVARSMMLTPQQHKYSELLQKNSGGRLTEREQKQLSDLGTEARRLTLRKAQACALLKRRGHRIPTLAEMRKQR